MLEDLPDKIALGNKFILDKIKSRRSLWLDCGILLSFMSEQVMGVEPTLPAWEAGVLPIYDTC